METIYIYIERQIILGLMLGILLLAMVNIMLFAELFSRRQNYKAEERATFSSLVLVRNVSSSKKIYDNKKMSHYEAQFSMSYYEAQFSMITMLNVFGNVFRRAWTCLSTRPTKFSLPS